MAMSIEMKGKINDIDSIISMFENAENDYSTKAAIDVANVKTKLILAPISFDIELAELRQLADELLPSYYGRAGQILTSVGARDCAGESRQELTILEAFMLDTVIRSFVRGLYDLDIRKEATKGLALNGRSLRGIYSFAEETYRTNLS